MAVKVLIPTPLRNLTQNEAEVSADGATIQEIIDDLGRKYAGLKDRLCDEKGKIRRFVNLYLNEEDIRFLQGEATAVKAGDQVSIVPAIAGGRN
ncbi:MAG TPA: MoaD/ThiS family protein [bacterium]|nr:MoaD/ThiS family protein [bacterium]